MRRLRTALGALLVLLAIALPIAAWQNAQALEDWWRLRNYTPPASVTTLANDATMTSQARHIFYVNQPKLIGDASTFRRACSQNEQTIVLGCYHPDQNGINVYDVQDARLHGVQEVTAAHEMLHAAYDRLSSKDKANVDNLLENFYKNDLHDQRVLDTINSYKKTEPNELVNEMHSIFGTEVPNLPAPLEAYYKKYFVQRTVVVGFAENYQDEFTTRLAQIEAYDAQLTDQKAKIDAEENSLSAQLNQINADRARLDGLRNSGQVDAYNAGVDSFNAKVDAYNRGVAQLKRDITKYNELVAARNSIAAELRSLDQSIDTRLSTQPTQ